MRIILILMFMAFGLVAQADEGAHTLVLKTGTLEGFTGEASLTYEQVVLLPANQAAADNENGQVRLTAEQDDMVALTFHKGDGQRRMGAFPQSVGNPLFMSFIEIVIRDMANIAGGSPFYIRNRIKETLVQPADDAAGSEVFGDRTITTQTVTLRPFVDDANKDRMRGFENLTLQVTMSDEVEGWYLRLDAFVEKDNETIYRRTVTRVP